jgi:hypothetical protein
MCNMTAPARRREPTIPDSIGEYSADDTQHRASAAQSSTDASEMA